MSSSNECRLAAVQESQASRAVRRKLFPNHLFSDPAWDILLALYATALQDDECGLNCMAGTGLATRPLLNWIDALNRDGLVATLTTNPPTFRLTLSGLSRMEAFFSSRTGRPHC